MGTNYSQIANGMNTQDCQYREATLYTFLKY